MVTKELLHTEIDRVSVEYLDELYEVIKRFTQSRQPPKKQSLMSKLKSIQ